MQFRALPVFVLAIAVIGLIGCAASTKIVNQWTNPEYAVLRFRRILVIAVSKQPGIRRTFEDEFVGLMPDEKVDLIQRQSGLLQQLFDGRRHGPEREAENIRAVHVQVLC